MTNPANVERIRLAIAGRGRSRRTVTALYGATVLHEDHFTLSAHRRRQAFLSRVRTLATERNMPFDMEELQQQLMHEAEIARNALPPARCGDSRNIREDNISPTPAPADLDVATVLSVFGIEILTELDDHSIELFVQSTRKCWTVKKINQWSEPEMGQALGAASRHLYVGRGSPPEGMYTPDNLRWAVALAASQAGRSSTDDILGEGVYQRGGRLLIVNGGRAFTYDGHRLRRVRRAKVGRAIVDCGRRRPWSRDMVPRVRQMDAGRAAAAFMRLHALLTQFCWRHPTDALVAASLVLATWIQACWTWRPLVHVTGQSNSGKSTFFTDLLKAIFGDWAILADRCTEAALRQAMGHDACPVLLDEFDDYKQRDQVCELFRTASRGGSVLRGTADQTGRRFRVRHLAWFASIEWGGRLSQDRNRRIRLELLKPDNRRQLELPCAEDLAELGQELAAAAIWAALRVVALANRIKRIRIEGVPDRLIESFSVPSAMLAIMTHGRDVDDATAIALLGEVIANREALEAQGEPEQERLLRDILSSTQTIVGPTSNTMETWTIAQLLATRDLGVSSKYLEPRGLRLLWRGRTAPAVFLVPQTLQVQLLRGTRWERVDLDQILMRLEGVSRSQQRCGGLRPWGIVLAWPDCLDSLERQDVRQDNPSG